MLCYRCGSHVPDGSEACSNCGQRFDTGLRGKTGQYRRRPLDIEAGGIKPGEVLAGRYEIRGALGSGPIGVVFRALDREVDVEVALKIIHPNLLQSVDERNEFLKSLKGAKRLSHPNLVRVYDVGQVEATSDQPARAYFTAQLLDGMTLRRLIDLRREKGQFFSVVDAEPIIAQIAQALDHAHGSGPHGDLKPENVVILPDLLKVVDFGVAPAIPRAPFLAALRMRKADVYLAPEVMSGHAFDRRADVYSLGVIFGEMVAGILPTPGGMPPELRQLVPGLPVATQLLYRRSLSSEVKTRFPTAGDFASELLSLAESQVQPPPLPPSSAAQETVTARPKAPPPPPPEAMAATPSPDIFIPPEALPTPSPDQVSPPRTPLKPGAKGRPGAPTPAVDQPTPQVDVVLDPRDLELKPKRRRTPPPPPVDLPAARRVARPLEPVTSSASTVDTAVRRIPTGSSWPIWLAVAAIALAASAVVAGHFFYAWKTREEERISEKVRAQERALAEQQLAERAQLADAGAGDAGPPSLAGSGSSGGIAPLRLGQDAASGGSGSSAGAGGTTGAALVAVAAPSTPGRAGAPERPDAGEAPEKHHREHRPVGEGPAVGEVAARAEAGCPSGMQLIPSGTFRFGTPASDDLGNFGDRPERKASVHAFCVDSFEYPNQEGGRPLTSVTYGAAEASCKRDGKRLCSEEEWEKACKGPGNRRFPYGDGFDPAVCRVKGGIGAAGAAAGCRSGFGVSDLSGNVAEWTASRFQAGASDRVVKGGSVESPDYELRCSARANRAPSVRSERLGFRCCADVK